jgi:glycosyltransferase involved in cell wall biosynthesis
MLRGRPFSWHAIFNFFCLLKIWELKKKGMADIIYLREIKLSRFLLKFRHSLKLPFVIEVHDLKIAKFYESCPERDKGEEYVFHRVNGIINLLHSFGDILKETYRVDGTPVVKVPLAAERMPFSFKDRGKGNIIGYIGQLYPMQGVDNLIEAMRYLEDARLSIIGGGERDLTRLRKLAHSFDVEARIDFHGFIAPHLVAEKARDADVLVICALDRGKRRYAAHTKLYEYMAMGKPIVAVDLPSVREDVTDGKDVILAKPGDPKDLAEKIRYVLHNHAIAESLARSAYASADTFTWDKRAAKLSAFFREILMNYQGM